MVTLEQGELIRQCALRVLDQARCGRAVDQRRLIWARDILSSYPAIATILGDGSSLHWPVEKSTLQEYNHHKEST